MKSVNKNALRVLLIKQFY